MSLGFGGGADWSQFWMASVKDEKTRERGKKLDNGLSVTDDTIVVGCDKEAVEIVIPDGITEICSLAFDGCKQLKSVMIPRGVKKIGARAFQGCESLEVVDIPDGVTELENNVFSDCTFLRAVYIPRTVVKIGSGIFYACPVLRHVSFQGSQEEWMGIKWDNSTGQMDFGLPASLNIMVSREDFLKRTSQQSRQSYDSFEDALANL